MSSGEGSARRGFCKDGPQSCANGGGRIGAASQACAPKRWRARGQSDLFASRKFSLGRTSSRRFNLGIIFVLPTILLCRSIWARHVSNITHGNSFGSRKYPGWHLIVYSFGSPGTGDSIPGQPLFLRAFFHRALILPPHFCFEKTRLRGFLFQQARARRMCAKGSNSFSIVLGPHRFRINVRSPKHFECAMRVDDLSP